MPELKASDLQFLVAVGSDPASAERAQSIEDTWGEQPNLKILYLGGVGSWDLPHSHDKEHHTMIVKGTESRPDDEQGMEWLKLQHRMLWGLKEMFNNGNVVGTWFISMGDDSIAFPDALVKFLAEYNPDMPVAFGHLISVPDVQGLAPYRRGGGLTWPDIEAGVAFSSGAILQLGPALYSDRCPFFLSASMTIGLCCWKMGVYLADHEGFRPVMPTDRTAPMPGLTIPEVGFFVM